VEGRIGTTVMADFMACTAVRSGVSSVPLDAPFELELLGGFELRAWGSPLSMPLGVKRLLVFLALQINPVLRTYVAGSLWPESTEDLAAGNLRSGLWRVGQVAPGLVSSADGYLALDPETAVDYKAALRMAKRILDNPTQATLPELDIALFSADLVPGRPDEWVVVERERFRQLRLHVLEAIADRFVSLGRIAQAVEAAHAAVSGEPLRESAHRTLIRAHLAEGNRSEALRQYASFRNLLHDELGAAPSRLMEELISDPSR